MIDGLKIHIAATELRTLVRERSSYHAKRAEEKSADLPGLRAALDKVTAQSVASAAMGRSGKGGYNLDPDSPVEALERDIETHKRKSQNFAFIAAHLADEDYALSEPDMNRLELIRSSGL